MKRKVLVSLNVEFLRSDEEDWDAVDLGGLTDEIDDKINGMIFSLVDYRVDPEADDPTYFVLTTRYVSIAQEEVE